MVICLGTRRNNNWASNTVAPDPVFVNDLAPTLTVKNVNLLGYRTELLVSYNKINKKIKSKFC